eukprot:scaffold15221_cov19-Prasinocladus_malaysianus.AAC.1
MMKSLHQRGRKRAPGPQPSMYSLCNLNRPRHGLLALKRLNRDECRESGGTGDCEARGVAHICI